MEQSKSQNICQVSGEQTQVKILNIFFRTRPISWSPSRFQLSSGIASTTARRPWMDRWRTSPIEVNFKLNMLNVSSYIDDRVDLCWKQYCFSDPRRCNPQSWNQHALPWQDHRDAGQGSPAGVRLRHWSHRSCHPLCQAPLHPLPPRSALKTIFWQLLCWFSVALHLNSGMDMLSLAGSVSHFMNCLLSSCPTPSAVVPDQMHKKRSRNKSKKSAKQSPLAPSDRWGLLATRYRSRHDSCLWVNDESLWWDKIWQMVEKDMIKKMDGRWLDNKIGDWDWWTVDEMDENSVFPFIDNCWYTYVKKET